MRLRIVMPRKKLSPEEIVAAGQDLNRRAKYYSEHPEELAKKREENRRLEERQIAKRMKKHQPQVTDIAVNGQFVHVYFVRNNGEPVIGWYKRIGWDLAPQKRANAAFQRRLARYNPVRSEDKAALSLPPDQGGTPRS